MNAVISPSTIANAESIPYTNADEAHRLLTTALSRFLNLIESLHADDWSSATTAGSSTASARIWLSSKVTPSPRCILVIGQTTKR